MLVAKEAAIVEMYKGHRTRQYLLPHKHGASKTCSPVKRFFCTRTS